MSELSTLYQTDYSAWATRNAELLRAGRYTELDVEHLLEELSDMSKSDQHALENRLTILLAHLLKWEYQLPTLAERWREFDGRSWRATIIEQRNRLAKLSEKIPRSQVAADRNHCRGPRRRRSIGQRRNRSASGDLPAGVSL